MIYKNRFTILGILVIILSVILNQQICHSQEYDKPNKKVLILGSYNSQNKWEESVIKGLKESIEDNITVKVDFLDSQSVSSDIYNESFMELLNLKYINDSIDCILTIDDEALELVRKNLFNENSFIYKKQVVFVGANSSIFISKEESNYITGILQHQDNLQDLDIILQASKNIEDIYLVIDKSIFSQTIKANIENLNKFTVRNFNIHIIEEYEFGPVKEQIKASNNDKSAIILCGSYKHKISGESIPPEKIISAIKNITKAPIYTKIEPYVYAGAIGGVVNDGDRLGSMASSYINSVLYEDNKSLLSPSYSSITTPLFNYDAAMYYNINLFALPKNTTFINKSTFDLLVPNKIKIITWCFILAFIFGIIYFICLYKNHKKNAQINDKLLSESLERHEIKTDFILTISHELRTPLNIIINSTKLLKLRIDEDRLTPKFLYNQLEMIVKNSNRLIRLINNIIDVSKIESGYIDTTFKNENIVDVIEDATLSVVDLANNYNIDIVFDTEEEEIITSIDRAKIERIMLNLLSNSIKFTKEGGEILVNIKRYEDEIIIVVKDNGIGMSQELQYHLYEKFRRAKLYPSLEREHEGSGLGLFIVKGLVEVHKGTIRVESKINEGTTFTITIPRAIVDEESSNYNLMKMPIEYVSQIELADINNKDEKNG